MRIDSGDTAEAQDVEAERVIEFPRGLPGFEAHSRFRLFHDAASAAPSVFWLRSESDPEVQFSVADPATLQVNYEISLSDDESALLQLDNAEDCTLLLILSRDAGSDGIRAHFLAPLLINTRARLGLQKVLNTVERSVTIRATD